tara:strand:+ start:19 stop:561 length:543 start_codon:yes stop_codon:yes gene_type:complete
MGFIVTGSITENGNLNRQVDSFYVRIENYTLHKTTGDLVVNSTHYISKESSSGMPIYKEDYVGLDASGMLINQFTYNGESYNYAYALEFPLTESVQVEQTTYSSSFADQVVEYVDFNDDGDEVSAYRTESIETITTGSEMVTKAKININIITGSMFQYAYKVAKNHYKSLFGASNVNDLI